MVKVSLNSILCLLTALEQEDAVISGDLLKRKFADIEIKVIKEYFLSELTQDDFYTPPNSETEYYVEYSDKQKSYFYINDYGKKVLIDEAYINMYEIDIDSIIPWIKKQFDMPYNRKILRLMSESLFCLGECTINNKKLTIYFARRLKDYTILNACSEYFNQHTQRYPIILLTSSDTWFPMTPKGNVAIIPFHKIIEHSMDEYQINTGYLHDIVYGQQLNLDHSDLPYIRCDNSGGVLYIGNRTEKISGPKTKYAIKKMVELWQDGHSIIPWSEIEGSFDQYNISYETNISAPKNFFSAKLHSKKIIGYRGKTEIWFTESGRELIHAQ